MEVVWCPWARQEVPARADEAGEVTCVVCGLVGHRRVQETVTWLAERFGRELAERHRRQALRRAAAWQQPDRDTPS